ncbi:NAD-dependent epimerase/dehydratase family protein [Lutibacter sp. B1]|uniref:NAD-dependent epimerase/dehydratase family protein n=1 Tax=Lutibacter sp. B1 TaxID=2725996 RepID=UPI0014573DFA|nr:NAD-dependent epimerase/dehydratase family protein [Lutibacter sp. B1]NLP58174.1 NAD-dependent epimerase/dehydratase family protein [Lutibacter sp. B1]
MKKVLITGMAGFIGYHLAKLLREFDFQIVGLDNINDYYDVNLKYARLKDLGFDQSKITYNKLIELDSISFIKLDLTDLQNIKTLFKEQQFDYVVNLAAQAGVRYSLKNPHSYVDSNITGFLNILESCRAYPVEHLVFASSSSVYGLSEEIPFHEDNCTDHPLAMYAASKKANEMMAHSYANLYDIPCTGLRFFTVYGPWGRPDMALHIFTKAMVEDKEFEVFNNGNMSRDFTYVADIVESIKRLMPLPPKENNPEFNPKKPTPSKSSKAYQLFNIGNNSPVALMDFITAIEKALGKKGKIVFKPMQPGDVQSTYANVESLFNYIDFKPQTKLEDGVNEFVKKYLELNE